MIEITYANFATESGTDIRKIKELMVRDSSWGTFIERLYASEKSCGRGAAGSWKKVEPRLTNLPTGRYEDTMFSLTFSKDNFDIETEGVDHLISTVAGDIVLYRHITNVEVMDFNFADTELYNHFPGPNIGIDRLYSEFFAEKLAGVNRPFWRLVSNRV